jgi:hypothetical protein
MQHKMNPMKENIENTQLGGACVMATDDRYGLELLLRPGRWGIRLQEYTKVESAE